MENLWDLQKYPTKLCIDERKVEVWRDVNTNLPTRVHKNKFLLTAQKILEANLDIGLYPVTISDVNDENRWMTFIRFESGSRFNIVVLKTRDDKVRVRAVDFVSKGERLRFKYEVEQPEFRFNLKCLVRQLDSIRLILEHCSKLNCTCCNYNDKEISNYFLLQKQQIKHISKPPSSTLKKWKPKLQINFHRAENHKNAIFNRISLNPFTINLRHKLWDKIEENNYQCEFQRFILPVKRRRRHSGNSSICSDCDDKCNHHATNRLKPSTSSENSIKRRNVFVSVQYGDSKCKSCGITFKNPRGLRTHNGLIHGREKVCGYVGKDLIDENVQCEECGLTLKNMRGLRMHKYHRHGGIYVRKSSLKAFEDVKSGEEGLVKVKEEVFDLTFGNEVVLDEKVMKTKVVVEKLKLFPCEKCDKEFLRLQNLKNHEKYCVRVVEDQENDNQVIPENENLSLQNENTNATTPLRDFDLNENLTDKTKDDSILHENQSRSSPNISIKLEEEPLVPDLSCGKEINENKPSNSDVENEFLFSPTGKFFVCEICEKSFKYEQSLTFHMAEHLNKNPVEQMFCSFCSESFENENELRLHLKVHFPKLKS